MINLFLLFGLCLCLPTALGLSSPFFRFSVLQQGNKNFSIPLATTVEFSPTNPDLLVAGSVLGTLTLLRIKKAGRIPSAVVLDTLPVGPGRAVTGIAVDPFNPDTFYVSTNSLQWRDQGLGESGWYNARIEKLKLDTLKFKLSIIDNSVASGLPVSLSEGSTYGPVVNHFTGSLMVAIGSFNNAGAPSPEEGNLPDCLLSGAILEIDVRSAEKTRTISWSSDDPATAEIEQPPEKTGISIFATGFRSSFQPVLSPRGRLLLMDGGADKSRGLESASCTSSRPLQAEYPDKVILVKKGKWYGHPNRRRAGECSFVSPLLPPAVAKSKFPGYTPPEFTNEEATLRGDIGSVSVGLTYYNANFWPRYRGMVLSSDEDITIPGRRTPALQLYNFRRKTTRRIGLIAGINIAVGPFGNIYTAQVHNAVIGVGTPRLGKWHKNKKGIKTVFPESGLPGSFVFIFGFKLGERTISVTIGGARCTEATTVRYSGRKMIRCRVPRRPTKCARCANERLRYDVVVNRYRLRKAFVILDPKLSPA